MSAALTRDARLADSRRKIQAPFVLDPSMRFYSPQENVDALEHPLVDEWIRFVETEWQPTPIAGSTSRVALLIPCCKSKPYPTSREHRGINAGLLAAGWRSTGVQPVPEGLARVLDADEDEALLDVSPLVRDGVVLDRFVISEPLGLVPYEHSYYWRGAQSPATSYDDPGLFEARGTSVSPERSDFTAEPTGDGRWKWGPAEREAYVDVHNRMAEVIATALGRLSPHYSSIVSWVSPGLTHRSFLADEQWRREDGLKRTRQGLRGPRDLVGALDLKPGLVEVMPTRDQLSAARDALAARLAAEGRSTAPGSVRSVFARGDGHDTPLGLPEAVAILTGRIDEVAA